MQKSSYIQLSGPIFEAVQLSRIFPDSKAFVDSIPLKHPEDILSAYHEEKDKKQFNLEEFVKTNFNVPHTVDLALSDDLLKKNISMMSYIELLWPKLYRQSNHTEVLGTLLPLPHPYIVPGGRFREVYYWDSFFSALGLIKNGMKHVVNNICDNFCYLIDTIGFIPNSTRIQQMTRSQPPFFALMIDLLFKNDSHIDIKKYYIHLEKEYNFWMNGKDEVTEQNASKDRVVLIDHVGHANRYYDSENTPREEAYIEDYTIAMDLPEKERPKLYRDIRAAAESGWDFSSRWQKDPTKLSTTRTTDLLPVDLNSLLYFMEEKLSEWADLAGFPEKKSMYKEFAEQRKNLIQSLFWSPEKEFFFDYSFVDGKRTNCYSLAAVYPLYFGIATKDQAMLVAEKLHNLFLQKGGLVTTLQHTTQQWDYPNGWAPLEWLAIRGLEKYGLTDLAELIRERFVIMCEEVFKITGNMYEKYNVVEPIIKAHGGEYPVQTGFGWTNGVIQDLLSDKSSV